MHDPLVVAFQIRRPWPKRVNWSHRRYHWPAMVTVWHREPKGHDSGTICRHVDKTQGRDGTWRYRKNWRWYLHVHHWKIQIHALQKLRRYLLTRCAWCGGPSRDGDWVNVSHQWDGPRARWWQGERDLYHMGCSSVAEAHRLCLCADPGLSQGDYGRCVFCGKFRAWRQQPDEADRILAALPAGSRLTPEIRSQVEPLWAERRKVA